MVFARTNLFLTMTDCWDQETLVNDPFGKIPHVLPRDTLGVNYLGKFESTVNVRLSV